MTLRIRVLCSILVLALPGVLASADAIELSAYTGEFEIYNGDRYTRITISAQENELVSRERGKDAVILLTPIAGEANAFSGADSEDKSIIFFYRFLRDEGGEFRSCLTIVRRGDWRRSGSIPAPRGSAIPSVVFKWINCSRT